MTSNYIDENGLTLQTVNDIVDELEAGFKQIYGDDINVGPNSPDGQMINLFAQSKIDVLDLISQVYNSFSPTSAIGRVLDQRCAINGVIRKAATKTTINLVVTTDRILTLFGYTSGNGTTFAAKDQVGNKFLLVNDATTINGANTLLFEAESAGVVEVTQDTITVIDTVTLGVVSVNNPDDPITNGVDEETDAALRFRRAASVSIPSQGYLEGLKGALLSLDLVTDCEVFENNTAATDANGIPEHSIWCVVEGGDNDEIADVIYRKRNAGCGVYGDVTVEIEQPNGFDLPIKFSRPTNVDLYIELTITSLDVDHTIDPTFLKQTIYDNINYSINQIADYSAISSIVKIADPLAVIIEGGVSADDVTYYPYLAPDSIDEKWVISTARITIAVTVA